MCVTVPAQSTLMVWGMMCVERRKQFFFEKKNQKTFALLIDAVGTIVAYRNE
jgi:hypothetical protein